MMVEESGGIVIVPAIETYDDLAEKHLELLFRYLELLTGDRDVAEAETLAAYRRLWEDLDAGRVFGDAEHILFRSATRNGLRRRTRSSELRGHLPPTTADDRLITATGIISNLSPQQQAAVYLAAWGGVDYDLVGVATGLGPARSRDLTFAARQEFCSERGTPDGTTPTCAEVVALLSAREDKETSEADGARIAAHVAECPSCAAVERLDAEFSSLLRSLRLPVLRPEFADQVRNLPYDSRAKRPGGFRRILRLAMGPALLVVVLYVGLVVIQGFSGEGGAVKTGRGRTSDVVLGRDASGGLIAVDSGSGRRLFTLTDGVLRDDGDFVFTGAVNCATAASCMTLLQRQDTNTRDTTDLGRVPGKLAAIAATGGFLYLSDENEAFGKLIAFTVEGRRVTETVAGPAGIPGAFPPQGALLSRDGTILTTLAPGPSGIDIVRTDLQALRVLGSIRVPVPAEGGLELVNGPSSGRLYAYEPGTGRLHEIDERANQISRTVDVSGRSAATAPIPGGATPRGTIAVGETTAYLVARTGGIAAVPLEAFEVANRLNADRDYRTLGVSSDGRVLYTVDSNNAYAVLDATTGEALLRRTDAAVAAILSVSLGD